MRVVAVSPHLDDAVFSAGAALAALAARGHDVRVVTTFTRSVPEPRGFALACQTDKGLGPEVDYMAVRRAEDEAAMAALGLPAPIHLSLAEAPHRGYESARALFAGPHAEDDVVAALTEALAPHLEGAEFVLAPLGLGNHVDHVQVRAALGPTPFVAWHDLPYALREPGPGAPGEVPPGPAKLAACAAYVTQLGFQFGGEEAMRTTMATVPERFDRRLPA